METFDIEQAFLEYLKMVKLNINDLNEMQLQETKRAFYGGSGYMIRALQRANNLPTQHESLTVFNNLEKQIENFFINEITG